MLAKRRCLLLGVSLLLLAHLSPLLARGCQGAESGPGVDCWRARARGLGRARHGAPGGSGLRRRLRPRLAAAGEKCGRMRAP